ncbi:propionyl-coenzyme A carboxylase alpha polypeptide [Salmonella enterica subsp. enterica]|nr:propionyl-coenzyme A carboxylase alpha polypeptide [Salmonella enterica subsp. enterica serovar Enteritidis]MIL09139.1 propionyl-coenzyme A carboxylase alpha polypeptide [Salmonella enterica subsp. enterica serovar Enteritidis]
MRSGNYPPLSCRTSPPQGGRSAGAAAFANRQIDDSVERAHCYSAMAGEEASSVKLLISPLEGEMSGRTEGGG